MTTPNKKKFPEKNTAATGILKYWTPPIMITGEELKQCTRDNSLTIKLWTNPGDPDTGTYESTIPLLDGTETPNQILHWDDILLGIFLGQKIILAKDRIKMIRRCMVGQALANFNMHLAENLKKVATLEEDATCEQVDDALLDVRTASCHYLHNIRNGSIYRELVRSQLTCL
jgi:hypothetical protein